MEITNITENQFQTFLDSFYMNIRKNKPKDNYLYYDGNDVVKIENVYITNCKVSNNNEKNKNYDSIVVKYKNKDNILCSFHVLLKQLKSFDFSSEIYSSE